MPQDKTVSEKQMGSYILGTRQYEGVQDPECRAKTKESIGTTSTVTVQAETRGVPDPPAVVATLLSTTLLDTFFSSTKKKKKKKKPLPGVVI